MIKLYDNKVWLHNRYILQRKSLEEIAAECQTTKMTISRAVIKHGLKRVGR